MFTFTLTCTNYWLAAIHALRAFQRAVAVDLHVVGAPYTYT